MPDVGDRETQGLRTLGNQTRKNWNRWGVINTDRGAGTGGTGTWGRSGGVGTGGMGHGGAGSGGRSGGAGRSRRFRGAGTGVCSGLGRATDGCWLGWVMSAWAPIANKTNMWCRFTYRLQFWIMTGILYSCHRSIFEYQTMCKSSVEVGLVYKTFANKHTRQWSPVQCCVMKRVDGRGSALALAPVNVCTGAFLREKWPYMEFHSRLHHEKTSPKLVRTRKYDFWHRNTRLYVQIIYSPFVVLELIFYSILKCTTSGE